MLIQDGTTRQGGGRGGGIMAAVGTPRRARHSSSRGTGTGTGAARGSREHGPGPAFSLLQATAGVGGLDELPDEMPSNFLCPISLEPMRDPVTLCTGQTFERGSIDKWLAAGNMTCPTTMQRLTDTSLIPNHTLRHVIEEWHRWQALKARRRAKQQAASLKDTSPADVRALLEEISLCKGLEEIVHSKGQGVIMKDLHGQDVRVLSSPEYSDTMYASLHQELVDGLLDMDIKEGVHLDSAGAGLTTLDGSDAAGWLGGLDLYPPRKMVDLNLPSPHRGPPPPSSHDSSHYPLSDSSSDEQEDSRPPPRASKDAHQHAMVIDSIRESQDARRLTVRNNTSLLPVDSGLKKLQLKAPPQPFGFAVLKSASTRAAESPRVTQGISKGNVPTKSSAHQTGEGNMGTKRGGTAKWRDTVVAKWNEIIRRGPPKAHKSRSSSTTQGESGKLSASPSVRGAGTAATTSSGAHEAKAFSSSVLRKSLTMSPIRESRSPPEGLVTSPSQHRRQLSCSTSRDREQQERSSPGVYDFSCDRVAVDPLTWEDLSRPRRQQQESASFGGAGGKGSSYGHSPPSAGGSRRNTPSEADGQGGLYGTSALPEQSVVSTGKWPLRRWISTPKCGQTSHLDRRRQGKVTEDQQDLVTDLLSADHAFPDPLSSPYDSHNMDAFSQESGSFPDFGREISLYSPQERHVWQGFVSPEQINLYSGPLSGPVSPLSVFEASASSEMVSPFSRLASTSAGGASPLSGFTSPFPGLASPLSGPLSGPISWPMSGPLSPFSVHSSSRSQSMGCITPPPTTQEDYFPFGHDDGLHKRELGKVMQGHHSLISSAPSNSVHSDDLAASMFPVLYNKHWENPLSSVSAGLGSPISRQVDNPALVVGQDEHEFLANPPPSPNKNFPSPVSGHAELSHSGPDGLQAMRLEALKKLHKFAASEHIHRFGMLDETVPVLLTALLPTLKSYNKGDLDYYARDCAAMVVKILVLLMPLTFTAAAQLAEQGALEALIGLTGEEASTGTRTSVVTLLGHMVETLMDGSSYAPGNGHSLDSELDAFGAEGCEAATGRLDTGWSGRIPPAMLDRDHHRQPSAPSAPDHKSVVEIVTTIATNRILLQRITRLLQTGRSNSQAAIASVSTMHLFCTCCSKALLSMIGAGAIPALVDLLPLGVIPPEDRVTDRVARILQLLELACATSEGRLALMHHYRSSIPRLVACLRPKNELRTEVALSVLSSLLAPHESGQSDKLSVAAVEAGAASKLVLLIQSGCSGAIKTKCTELLKYLSNKYSATTMFLYHNNLTQTLQ